MRFTQLATFIAVSMVALADQGAALNYRGYSSTVSCSGPAFGCSDNGGVCCGPMPAGFGFSAQFDNLPAGAQGQGYTDACRSFLFVVFGPGTRCWNGGGARASFLNWFHSASRTIEATGRGAADASGCTPPNEFSYEDGKGVTRAIKIPTIANATEVVAELYKNENWAALEGYESA